ncbi:unnamed protein product [Urochloa decumbens]|uniref:Uncharacterized protein n=1 Tax=Urochloa decumbens TaxID=240449 RepID=A0ABC9BUN2_9POAL
MSMASGPRRGRGLLFLLLAIVAASLSTVVTSQEIQFTRVDCQTLAEPSPAPSSSSSNSTFWYNVVALLEALPSAAAPTGFASLSCGTGADAAFVRGICRGDTLPADCADYLRSAALGIRSSCNSSSRRAAIWYDDGSGVTIPAPMFCFLSYGDTNASTAYERRYRKNLHNRGEANDKRAFENTYSTLMARLATRVVNGSSDTTPSSSLVAPVFATGEAMYYSSAVPNGTSMYGMVQCMRDRTAAECDRCLQDSIRQLPTCCYGNMGGVVLGYDCYLRMEMYTFYDLALDPAPAPPPLVPSPASTPAFNRERHGKNRTVLVVVVVIFAFSLTAGIVLVLVAILVAVFRYKKKTRQKIIQTDTSNNEDDISYDFELDPLSLSVLTAATNNFAKDNKLGEGGFGEVFKGTLPHGEVIAVKRLSQQSSQGFHELKNELVLVAKLKHRNLVRLMGVCLQGKLLVYEYMPNRSLDTILFDPMRRQQLDWSKRFMIICGITRGLLYLHEESRLKVIHRDLKPSNVLLDADLNPKISDFGLAKAFVTDQSRDVTIRPVGTLGYMPPEYAYFGHVSTKTDMFSFGVIVLEMVTGRRSNSMSDSPDSTPLLSYVWEKWRTGSATDVVDASLGTCGQYPESEVLSCIEVGLLCVQENPNDRPDASSVVLMLSSPTSSPGEGPRTPSRPAFFFGSNNISTGRGPATLSSSASLIGSEQTSTEPVSNNDVTISEFQPR